MYELNHKLKYKKPVAVASAQKKLTKYLYCQDVSSK